MAIIAMVCIANTVSESDATRVLDMPDPDNQLSLYQAVYKTMMHRIEKNLNEIQIGDLRFMIFLASEINKRRALESDREQGFEENNKRRNGFLF
jgi:hypothetical protein